MEDGLKMCNKMCKDKLEGYPYVNERGEGVKIHVFCTYLMDSGYQVTIAFHDSNVPRNIWCSSFPPCTW